LAELTQRSSEAAASTTLLLCRALAARMKPKQGPQKKLTPTGWELSYSLACGFNWLAH